MAAEDLSMHCDYADIRDKIQLAPLWFDEMGVPRYADFTPRQLANIYARECCLVRIACQGCGHLFVVAFSSQSTVSQVYGAMAARGRVAELGYERLIDELRKLRDRSLPSLATTSETLLQLQADMQALWTQLEIDAARDANERKRIWDERPTLADQVRSGTLHYGDPPNVRCCPAGPTMNSIPRQVLEFWESGPVGGARWRRVADLEVALACDWEHDEA